MTVTRLPSVVYLLSFLAALMPLAAYEAHEFTAAFLLLAGIAVHVMLQGVHEVRATAVVVLGFAFWALALASAILSEAPYISFIYFCFFSALPLSFLLGLLVAKPEEFFKITGIGLAVILAALAVFTIVQFFFIPGMLYKGAAHWPFADPNSFAGIFSLGFFSVPFGLMLGGRNRIESNAGLFLALLFLAVIFLARSKAAVLALIPALVIFMFAAQFHVKKHRRCCAMLIAGGAAIFAALCFSGAPLLKIAAGGVGGRHSDLAQRIAEMTSAWHIAQDHFRAGTGIGTFFLYYPAYRGADYHSAGFMAHSDPLQFFAEMGVLAPVLFYGVMIAAILATVKKFRALHPEDPKRIYILAPFCALGAMVAHSHVNFHFNILPMLMASGLLLGFWHGEVFAAPVGFQKKQKAAPQVLAAGIVMMALVFSALHCSEILVSRAQEKIAAGDMEGFAADINMAGRLSMNTNARALVLAAAIPLGVLESGHRALVPNEKKDLISKADKLLARAEKLNPRMAGIFYDRARLAKFSTEQTPEAMLRRALAVDQLHTASRVMLAEVLEQQGRKQDAFDLMKAGFDWPNNTPEYFRKLGALALELHDMEMHDTAVAKMLVANGHQMATIQGRGELRASGRLK